MKKVSAPKDVNNNVDKMLLWARKNYVFGNFYQARKLVRNALSNTDMTSAQKADAANIIMLTSIDKLAFAAGFLCLLLTIVAAFIVGY
jgi:hypothetical protein